MKKFLIIIFMSIIFTTLSAKKSFSKTYVGSAGSNCMSDLFFTVMDYVTLGYGSGYGYIDDTEMYEDAENKKMPHFVYVGIGAAPNEYLRFDLFINYYEQKGMYRDSLNNEVPHEYNIFTTGFSFSIIPFGQGPYLKLGLGTCSFTSEGEDGKYGKLVFEGDSYRWQEYHGTAYIIETGFLIHIAEMFQFSLNFQYAYHNYHTSPAESSRAPSNSSYYLVYTTASFGFFEF